MRINWFKISDGVLLKLCMSISVTEFLKVMRMYTSSLHPLTGKLLIQKINWLSPLGGQATPS